MAGNASFDKAQAEALIEPTYARRSMKEPFPAHELPRTGMTAMEASQICQDELSLDGTPGLNLASFVTTWMEPEASKLISECLNKNLVDQDEYPYAVKIERRCVQMIARLFHAPGTDHSSPIAATGTSTVGSSEAIMLAGLALKWRWRMARQQAGKADSKPNIVMGSNVQVVWDKFARYFDVEPRFIQITAEQTTITAEQVIEAVDENTIAVVAILGTTFTGEFEPVAEIARALDLYQKKHQIDIPIHVDAASGGFIAPFTQPKLKWDFRLERIASINVSGHKYGLVYPGVGWIIWRDQAALPKDLIFDVNYLGGHMPTFNLNFSRPSAFVIAQYYNFLRLGHAGYASIMEVLMTLAARLTQALQAMGKFKFLSQPNALPVVAVVLDEGVNYTVYDISSALRGQKWIVPAYSLPPPAEQTNMLRFVIREGMNAGLIDQLIEDVKRVIAELEGDAPVHSHKNSKRKHVVC